MSPTVLLLISLTCQGYWFGGRPGQIAVTWAARDGYPEAVLTWQLMHGQVTLAEGQIALPEVDEPARLTVTPPVVRVRTAMTWTWQLFDQAGGKQLAEGSRTLHVFPEDLLEVAAARLADRPIVVWETARPDDAEADGADGAAGALSATLTAMGIAHERTTEPAPPRFIDRSMLLLVGQGRLAEVRPFAQARLLSYAKAGASVMVFEQPADTNALGYELAARQAPDAFTWRRDHALLDRFEPADLASLVSARSGELAAVQLPADEPALEIAYWPLEAEGPDPVPIDALLVTRTVGAGRIVLCQLPIETWSADPRTRLLLANALDYLRSRPAPTPPPSQRSDAPAPAKTPVPTIPLP